MSQLVSVIIPTYNVGQYLEASVRSVLSQSHSEIECIIVDDGSTDDTKNIADGLVRNDSRVSYYFKENGGAASARNFGVRYARGDWVILMDSDDWMCPETIEIQLTRARESGLESKVIVYSDFEVVWQDSGGMVKDRYTNNLSQMTKQQLIERIMSYEAGPTMPLSPINTLLSRDIFDSVAYDESFGGWEEINLFIDLLLMEGTAFLYAKTVASVYRIHGSNTFRDKDRMFDNYIRFLYATHNKDDSLLRYCVRIGPLLRNAIMQKDKKKFEVLVALVKSTRVPVYLFKNGININLPVVLRMIYLLRTVLPARQMLELYERVLHQRQ